MVTTSFIKVDDNSINLTQAIGYLQKKGTLGDFVNDIIHQYILEQELATIELENGVVKNAIADFCKANNFTPEKFEQWLEQESQTKESFRDQVARSIQFQELIDRVTEPKISEYFIKHKLLLDSFILSRLIVEEKELAEELKTQIIEKETSFEALAKEYSIANESHFNGMMGVVSRGQLEDTVRAALDKAQEGDIVGVIPLDNCWCLLRVEQIIPASLKDRRLIEKIKQEIFEDYLTEKMKKLQIEMNLVN